MSGNRRLIPTTEMVKRVANEIFEEARKRDVEAQKQETNMLRAHRKLMRRHAQKIPPATAAIWETLYVGQQYAILKDIDYAERHEDPKDDK